MFAKPAGIMRIWLPALLVLLTGAAAYAGPDEQGSSSSAPRKSPDFLFGRPDGSIGIRGNWLFSRASSDWYDFVTDELTLQRGDFNGPEFAFDVGFTVKPRLDIVAGVDVSNASTKSEVRNFVDNNRLPIEQETELRGSTITASVRYALMPRGREVGSVAWVPSSIVPYIGAGGGAHWYRLRQQGDFRDATDNSIFTDVFESSGWKPSAHVFGGAALKLHRRVYLTLEARYQWTKGDLGTDFVNFDPIDLTGLHIGTGVNFIF